MDDHFYAKDSKGLKKLAGLKNDMFKSFLDFDGKVFAEGSLSVKTKELIAIGAAHITRCPYCIDSHVKRAKKAGATDEEIAEAVFVGVAMSAGAAVAHSRVAMDAIEPEK